MSRKLNRYPDVIVAVCNTCGSRFFHNREGRSFEYLLSEKHHPWERCSCFMLGFYLVFGDGFSFPRKFDIYHRSIVVKR